MVKKYNSKKDGVVKNVYKPFYMQMARHNLLKTYYRSPGTNPVIWLRQRNLKMTAPKQQLMIF